MSWLDKQLVAELDTNHLEQLLDTFPHLAWYYQGMSLNPNITWEIVQKNLDKAWSWKVLSRHANITWDIIKNNPDGKWTSDIILNPNITWEIVLNNPEQEWDTPRFVNNPNITMEVLQQHPPSFWSLKIYKMTLTWEMVLYLTEGNSTAINDMILYVASSPGITWDDVAANPQYNWDYYALSSNPNITWDIVAANCSSRWDYMTLSENPGITIESILDNIALPWDWYIISRCKNMSFVDYARLGGKLVRRHCGLLANPHFTIESLQSTTEFEDGYSIIRNPNITSEYIISHNLADGDGACSAITFNKFNKHPTVIENIKKKYELRATVYHGLTSRTNKDIARIIAEFV